MPTTDNVCLIGSRWPHTNIFAKQKSHDRDGIYRMLQECQLKLRLDEERSSLKVYGLCNAWTKHVLRLYLVCTRPFLWEWGILSLVWFTTEVSTGLLSECKSLFPWKWWRVQLRYAIGWHISLPRGGPGKGKGEELFDTSMQDHPSRRDMEPVT